MNATRLRSAKSVLSMIQAVGNHALSKYIEKMGIITRAFHLHFTSTYAQRENSFRAKVQTTIMASMNDVCQNQNGPAVV